MLWVTRQKPHVDRCASAWLIKRFIDNEAVFQFITKEQKMPKGGTAFTMPKAEINPVEGVKTTFDVLMQKCNVNDPTLSQIGDIMRDYELNEETAEKLQLRTTLAVCYVLKGLEKTSQTDAQPSQKRLQ